MLFENISDDKLRQRLSIGEDQRWEFKQILCKGDQPISPKREDLADEITAIPTKSKTPPVAYPGCLFSEVVS